MSTRRSLQATLALLLLVASPAVAGQSQPGLRVVRPAADEPVSGSTVVVELEVEGAVLGGRSRNGAYALLTLDDMPPVKSLAPLFRFRNVAPGNHQLVVELRRQDGSAFEPPVEARVRFRSESRSGRSR